ncbi:hypothetical protein OV203_02440 [Nannocystis sp. ILAH1]|uniref:hypothetical protein n=1 Tax=Nannocystis sp. ILAH1 TaxID=2996789 RepID=UPI00226FE138|nr:hypothetical protein [Nannocystis sp. ILAH1]MCY0985970.1 hypothetical protein [Nannocystis sp. ILAH1]
MFPCEHICRRPGTTLLRRGFQVARHCTLAGFDQRHWQGEPRHMLRKVHMGAPRRYDLEQTESDWAKPAENIADEGCPGGWQRAPFTESVLRYRRRPAEGGARVPNRLLDLQVDELVIEAVEFLEVHEDAWRSEYLALRLK